MIGRIASKLTTNSQCTHWVNDPSPPVTATNSLPISFATSTIDNQIAVTGSTLLRHVTVRHRIMVIPLKIPWTPLSQTTFPMPNNYLHLATNHMYNALSFLAQRRLTAEQKRSWTTSMTTNTPDFVRQTLITPLQGRMIGNSGRFSSRLVYQ